MPCLHCVQSEASVHGGEQTCRFVCHQDVVRESASELGCDVAKAVIKGAVGISFSQKRLGGIVEMLKLCQIVG